MRKLGLSNSCRLFLKIAFLQNINVRFEFGSKMLKVFLISLIQQD